MNRLIALDLDGTLLNPDHQITPRTNLAVRNLVKSGWHVCLASGRMHQSTAGFGQQLGLTGPTISYNGSIVRLTTGEEWLNLSVPAEIASEVVTYCHQNNLHLNYYLNDQLYIAEETNWSAFYVRQTGSYLNVVGDLSQFDGQCPTKLIIIQDIPTADKLVIGMRDRFGDSVYVLKTNPEYVEFMNPSANKGAALSVVAEKLGVLQKDVWAVGDAENDIPMVMWAGTGIAMKNVYASVIEAADRVIGRNDEEGLATFLEELAAT